MSFFTGGTIPTLNVSSSSLVNNAVTGIAGNLAFTGLSVALSPTLGAELSNQLGLDPNASFSNIGNIISNGVVSTGGQYLNQIISQQVTNSKALGPFGPLVGGLTQSAAGVLTRGVSGLVSGQGLAGFNLGSLLGGQQSRATASAPNNVPSRAFPGAGDEPYGDKDANYGQNRSFVYNLGDGGKDVEFYIQLAKPPALQTAEAAVANPAAPATSSLNEAYTNTTLSGYNQNFQSLTTANLSQGFNSEPLSQRVIFPGTSENLAYWGGVGSYLQA